MENCEISHTENPLETESISKLILKYSLAAIASSLVSSVYNIADQIFVGNKIGELGNAATNVAFPLVMVITTLAMTFGAGSSASFSLYLGQKEKDRAKSIVGNGMTLVIAFGVLVTAISLLLLRPLLTAFGGRAQTLEYAIEYTRILAFGFPFAILGTGASQLIRADGSPKYAMFSTLSGAVLNCILDPILIFGFNIGISGAALASTVLFSAFLKVHSRSWQIISVFGSGDALYFEFAARYFHVFLFCTFVVGVQILSAQFFRLSEKAALEPWYH